MRNYLDFRFIAGVAVAIGLTLAAPAGVLAAGPSEFCGGVLDVLCERGVFCEMSGGVCGAGDRGGACAGVPRICSQSYRPVCGCNGTTYTNDCSRQMARMSKQHEGRC
jgi:hypothetical protein